MEEGEVETRSKEGTTVQLYRKVHRTILDYKKQSRYGQQVGASNKHQRRQDQN